MAKKKISECIKVLINVGNYQNIEIAKYAETEIEYGSKEEMVKMEDELTSDLIDNIIRNMKTIPDRLGKKIDVVEKFEDSVKKSIPEWLNSSPVQNLANSAQKLSVDSAARQDKKTDDGFEIAGVSDKKVEVTPVATKAIVEPVKKPVLPVEEASIPASDDDDDLFK